MVMEDCLLKPPTIALYPRVLAQNMRCYWGFLINALLAWSFEQVA